MLSKVVSSHSLLLTCFKACSRRVCLDTESLQTVSQRLLSSCSCTFTQVVSSRLFSISSRPERFSTCTVPVRFPSSFWKTWSGRSEAEQGWAVPGGCFTGENSRGARLKAGMQAGHPHRGATTSRCDGRAGRQLLGVFW